MYALHLKFIAPFVRTPFSTCGYVYVCIARAAKTRFCEYNSVFCYGYYVKVYLEDNQLFSALLLWYALNIQYLYELQISHSALKCFFLRNIKYKNCGKTMIFKFNHFGTKTIIVLMIFKWNLFDVRNVDFFFFFCIFKCNLFVKRTIIVLFIFKYKNFKYKNKWVLNTTFTKRIINNYHVREVSFYSLSFSIFSKSPFCFQNLCFFLSL